MKRLVAGMVLLALAAVGIAGAYQAAARERDYRLLLSRGDTALHDGKTFDAIESYSGAIALRPDSMLAYLRLGETYLQRADLDAAAGNFGKAAALDPSATRPLEDLGDVQYRRQRFSQAAESYEARLRLDDRSAAVTYKLALAQYRSGELDKALIALAQALSLNDQFAEAYYLRGMCLRDEHRPAEALEALERAVALSPASIPAREELADLYGSLNRLGDQIEQLQALAALDREHVERQVALGLAHARAAHWDLAILTLGGALERTPNAPLVYRALGRVWLDRPRDRNDRVYLSKAREALERVATAPDAASDVLALYGRALLQEGDAEGAERILRRAVASYPVEPTAFVDYAVLAERQDHLDTARTALIDYTTLAPDDVDVTAKAAHIGSLSLRLNDAAAAVVWLRRATEAAPNNVPMLAALADAQLRAGDRPGAEATIGLGMQKDPKNAQLQALAREIRPR